MSNHDPLTTVPNMYVDAAEFQPGEFSFRVLLGTHTPGEAPTPALALTMSPSFAVSMAEAMVKALEAYLEQADDDGEAADDSGDEATDRASAVLCLMDGEPESANDESVSADESPAVDHDPFAGVLPLY